MVIFHCYVSLPEGTLDFKSGCDKSVYDKFQTRAWSEVPAGVLPTLCEVEDAGRISLFNGPINRYL